MIDPRYFAANTGKDLPARKPIAPMTTATRADGRTLLRFSGTGIINMR